MDFIYTVYSLYGLKNQTHYTVKLSVSIMLGWYQYNEGFIKECVCFVLSLCVCMSCLTGLLLSSLLQTFNKILIIKINKEILVFFLNRRLKEESHCPSGRNLLSKAKTSIPLNPRMFTGLWFANGYSPTSWVIYIFSFNQHVPEASSVSGFHSCKRTRHDRKNFSEQMSFRQILIAQKEASLNHFILNCDILTIKWGISIKYIFYFKREQQISSYTQTCLLSVG